MKELLKIVCIFALFVIAIPLPGLIAHEKEENVTVETPAERSETPAVSVKSGAEVMTDDGVFRVLDIVSGQVIEMTVRDYVKGAVMAEMPASYNSEALKAQAVAAHTYAVRRKKQQEENPDPLLCGAYISNDSGKYQAYFTPAQARELYGAAYEEYDRKVSAAVDDVINEILVYSGEPIIAAFHALSCGITESAENVWGQEIAYLVPAESEGDKGAPAYLCEKAFTSAELEARFSAAYDVHFPDEKENWAEVVSRSASGSVAEVRAGDVTVTGAEARALLNLRSACFDIRYEAASDEFIFTTKGSGHGVGMSQYGANVMAENGCTYREILAHYYKGAELITLT